MIRVSLARARTSQVWTNDKVFLFNEITSHDPTSSFIINHSFPIRIGI